jgi:hypothetical protein
LAYYDEALFCPVPYLMSTVKAARVLDPKGGGLFSPLDQARPD